MSEQIKAALVLAAGIVVATFVYTWTTAYFSPYEQCMRNMDVWRSIDSYARMNDANFQRLSNEGQLALAGSMHEDRCSRAHSALSNF